MKFFFLSFRNAIKRGRQLNTTTVEEKIYKTDPSQNIYNLSSIKILNKQMIY